MKTILLAIVILYNSSSILSHQNSSSSEASLISSEKPKWITPFVGMSGFIIASDVNPWQVTSVNSARQTAVIVVSSGPLMGTYTKVPFADFDKNSSNDFIVTGDGMPYQ